MDYLSYLEAFDPKTLRSMVRILRRGYTLEDIDKYLNRNKTPALQPKIRLVKPCCGGDKVDKQVKAFREKQKRLRMERSR